MKIIHVGLVLSLVVNLALLWRSAERKEASPEGVNGETSVGRALTRGESQADWPMHGSASSEGAEVRNRLPPGQQISDPHEIVQVMKRAGIHDLVIRNAVGIAVKLKYQSERLQIAGLEKGNFPRHETAFTPTPQQAEALQLLNDRERAETEALVGPVEDILQMRADAMRQRFGDLPRDKITALEKIEADYQDLQRKAQMVGPDGATRIDREIQAKLAEEKEMDIRRVLSSEQAKDYFRYNSDGVRELRSQISRLRINEATYVQLADLALANRDAMRTKPVTPQGRFDGRTMLFENYRAVLGERDFLTMARSLDPVGATLMPLYQTTSLPLARQSELFFAARRAANLIEAAGPLEKPAVAAQAYQALTIGAGLTPEQIASFDKTPLGTTLKKAGAIR